jgi:heme oxygenase (biliverdin-IX-beta and delta-forming)
LLTATFPECVVNQKLSQCGQPFVPAVVEPSAGKEESVADLSETTAPDTQTLEMRPLSQQLRLATAKLHHRAEELLDIPALMFDRRSYADTLDRFYGFYFPLEQALRQYGGWGELGLSLRQRSHVRRLFRDLIALGRKPSRNHASDVGEMRSFEHALGALYVMEGSTLGGRVILRRLEESEIDVPTGAKSFFSGHGPTTGAMWRSFVGNLDAFGERHPTAQIAVQRGAQRTFGAVMAWFEPFCEYMRQRR